MGSSSTAGSDAGDTTDASETGAAPTTGRPDAPAVCAGDQSIDPFPDPATCDEHRGEPPTAELAIGVLNRRSEPVFIHGDGTGVAHRVRVTGEPGGRSVHAAYVCGDDPSPCDLLLEGEFDSCELIGREYSPIRIDPGLRHRLVWEPVVVFPVELPDACLPFPIPDPTCTTSRRPTPGPYTLSLTYSLECEGPCTCEPGPDGGCQPGPDAHLSGPTFTALAAYDGVCDVVDIVID